MIPLARSLPLVLDDGTKRVVDPAAYDWEWDAHPLVKRFSDELPAEVWMVGIERGETDPVKQEWLATTYRFPDGDKVPEVVARAATYFPSLPPDEVLTELEAMWP